MSRKKFFNKNNNNSNIYKCPHRLLMSCNKMVEGLDGQKMHLTKVLAWYCYIRKKINSGHIHNYSKIGENFTELKGFISNTSFKKYNLLLVKYKFAEFDNNNVGIKLYNLEKTVQNVCEPNKANCERESFFRFKFNDKIKKLKNFHNVLVEQLFDDTFKRVLKADELKHVKSSKGYRKEVEQEKLQKNYFNYFNTTLIMSNKQIGKMFDMSSNIAKRFKNFIMKKWKNDDVEFKFMTYITNVCEYDNLFKKYPSFKYYNLKPSYYVNRSNAIKNFGQRIVVLDKNI